MQDAIDLESYFPDHEFTHQLVPYVHLLSGLFEQAFVLLLIQSGQQRYLLTSDDKHSNWVHWALQHLPGACDEPVQRLSFFLPGYDCCFRSQPCSDVGELSILLNRQTKVRLTKEQEMAFLTFFDAISQLIDADSLHSFRQTNLFKTEWPFAGGSHLQGQALLDYRHDVVTIVKGNGAFTGVTTPVFSEELLSDWLKQQLDTVAVDVTAIVRLCQLPRICELTFWRLSHTQGLLVLHDITAERELRRVHVRERRLQGLFDSGIAGMIGLNEHSELVFANDTAKELLWLPPNDTHAKHYNLRHVQFYLLDDETDSHRIEAMGILPVLATKQVARCRLVFPDNSQKIVEFRGRVRQDIDNPEIIAYCMLLDVTHQYQLQQALTVMRQHVDNLLSFSPVVLYQAAEDLQDGFLYVSPNAQDILGCSAEQILAEPGYFFSRVHPEDQALIRFYDQPDNREYRFWAESQQQYIWLKDIRRSDADDLLCIYGALTNISARKMAELEQQRLSRELMRQQQQQVETLQALTEGVVTIDQFGKILQVNPAICSLFGYETAELEQQPVSILMPPSDAGKHDSYISHYLEGGPAQIIGKGRRVVGKHKNGLLFPLRLSVAELPSAESGHRLFVGCLHDLTQAEQQQDQLLQAGKLSAIGTLTSGIAHDFNNILGIVRGYAELLAGHVDDSVSKTAANLIKAADRGSALTKSLLDFSSNRSRETAETELGQLIVELQPMLQEACSKSQVSLQLQTGAGALWANIEKGGLENVLLNMVINAVHACQANTGVAGIVSVSCDKRRVETSSHFVEPIQPGDYVCLCIKDNGCGMSEQVQRKIFEPFFTTKGAQGTGLGLAQVFGFIRRSQGGIVVTSAPGVGTSFELYLPVVAVPARAHIAKPAAMHVADTATPRTSDSVAAGHGEILLVDDDVELLEVHGAILEMAGFQVTRCDSGAAALTELRQHPYRLMVSDIMMPEMNGFELSQAARQYNPALNIQLVSGFADDSLIKDPLSEQLYQLRLQKPVRASQLIKRVKELLSSGVEPAV